MEIICGMWIQIFDFMPSAQLRMQSIIYDYLETGYLHELKYVLKKWLAINCFVPTQNKALLQTKQTIAISL